MTDGVESNVAVTGLLLGPVLRHVGERDATVWVETSGPCMVEVLGHQERTWTVAGHHYALVLVDGLLRGSVTPYEVRLDGEVVWPLPDAPHLSVIRTLRNDGTLTVVFGSCRFTTSQATGPDSHYDADSLDAYSRRMMDQPPEQWPDALLLLGDQVYADELSPAMAEANRSGTRRRRAAWHAGAQLRGVHLALRRVVVGPRGALAPVNSPVVDDLRRSRRPRRLEHLAVVAGRSGGYVVVGGTDCRRAVLVLGVSASGESVSGDLGANDLYQRVRAHSGDVEPMLREFASAADEEADGAKGTRWSYRRDLGPARLLMIDSRCGRVLANGHRSMVSEPEFRWIEEQSEGVYDHLLVGTSCRGCCRGRCTIWSRGTRRIAVRDAGSPVGSLVRVARRTADLEHWAAFRESFERLAACLFGSVVVSLRANLSVRPPRCVCYPAMCTTRTSPRHTSVLGCDPGCTS